MLFRPGIKTRKISIVSKRRRAPLDTFADSTICFQYDFSNFLHHVFLRVIVFFKPNVHIVFHATRSFLEWLKTDVPIIDRSDQVGTPQRNCYRLSRFRRHVDWFIHCKGNPVEKSFRMIWEYFLLRVKEVPGRQREPFDQAVTDRSTPFGRGGGYIVSWQELARRGPWSNHSPCDWYTAHMRKSGVSRRGQSQKGAARRPTLRRAEASKIQ